MEKATLWKMRRCGKVDVVEKAMPWKNQFWGIAMLGSHKKVSLIFTISKGDKILVLSVYDRHQGPLPNFGASTEMTLYCIFDHVRIVL